MRKSRVVRILLVLMLVVMAMGKWKVSLTPSNIVGHITVGTTPKQVVVDQVHVSEVQLGTGDFSKVVSAVFDTTTLTNWFVDQKTAAFSVLNEAEKKNVYQCKPPCAFLTRNGNPISFPEATDNVGTPLPSELRIFGDRFTLSHSTSSNNLIGRNATDKAIFHGKNLVTGIPFLVPNDIQFNPSTNINLKSVGKLTASFGLGHPEYVDRKQTNFVDKVNQSGQQLEQLGFSFYIHDQISQVIFGSPENYFGNGDTHRIRNLDETAQSWKSKLTLLKVGDRVVGKSSTQQCRQNAANEAPLVDYATSLPCTPTATPPGEAQPQIVFDSTTKYLWAPKAQIDVLVEEMGLRDPGRTFRFNDTVKMYEAPCQQEHLDSQFPDLELHFFEVDKPLKVKGSDYVTYDATKNQKNCWLNVRPNLDELPADKKLFWYLGTSFFKSNYCFFDQQANFINCQPAFQFTPQEKHIGEQSRIVALVLGAIILVGALAVLLSLFTKVPPFQKSHVPLPSPPRNSQIELGRTIIQHESPQPVPVANNSQFPINNQFPPAASYYNPNPQPFNPYQSQYPVRNY